MFEGDELELMLGYISALLGCCIWLLIATLFSLPVSGTHSIVGSTIGMAIVSKGLGVIKWLEVAKIASSWVISPLLSGGVSVLMFLFVKRFILKSENPLNSGLALLPIIYTLTIFINLGGILEAAPPLLGLHLVPWWGRLIILAGVSVIMYLVVWLILVPFLEQKIYPILPKNLKSSKAKVAPKSHDTQSTFSAESYFDSKKISNKIEIGVVNTVFEMPR